jgi:hypothetical protein
MLTVPGATPSTILAAASKNGHMFLLDPKNLGGMSGHLLDLPFSTGPVASSLLSYTTTTGVHLLVNTADGGPCGAGSLVSFLVTPTNPPELTQAWCAPIGGHPGQLVTTSDGKNNPVVWSLNGGYVSAYDGNAGFLAYNGANAPCPSGAGYRTPIAVKGRIIVGGDNQLCSLSPH